MTHRDELDRASAELSERERSRLEDLESRIQGLCDLYRGMMDDGGGGGIKDVLRMVESVISGFTPTVYDDEDEDYEEEEVSDE